MKILLDMGHCLSGGDTGASGCGYLEQNCTREIGYKVKAKLESLGHTVVVCSCDSSNSLIESLSYRVNTANSNGGDLYVSIHINAGGGVGTEVYAGSPKDIAQKILNEFIALGFVNRGVKDGNWLYVVKHTNMPALLVECCFIDTKSDMDKYNAENFANAIVKGVTGQEVGTVQNIVVTTQPVQQVQPSPQPIQQPVDEIANCKRYVGSRCLELQQKLNKVIKAGLLDQPLLSEDGDFGKKSYDKTVLFEQKYGLVANGYAGAQTFGKLDELIAQINRPQPQPSKPVNQNVLAFQRACNAMGITDSDGHRLAEDGSLGSHTLSTIPKIGSIVRGAHGELVKWVQMMVGCSQDGSFGGITESAVESYQSRHGLQSDGHCGQITLTYMLQHC